MGTRHARLRPTRPAGDRAPPRTRREAVPELRLPRGRRAPAAGAARPGTEAGSWLRPACSTVPDPASRILFGRRWLLIAVVSSTSEGQRRRGRHRQEVALHLAEADRRGGGHAERQVPSGFPELLGGTDERHDP